MNIKQINKNIKYIAATGAKLDAIIHATAVACLVHAMPKADDRPDSHGDTRPLQNLVNALGKGYRVEGFKIWVKMFSPISWNRDGVLSVSKEGTKFYVPFDIATATERPFWTLEEAKERVVKELSPEALKALVDRFIKDVNAADEHGDVYGKDGKVHKHVKGDVVQLKAYAARVAKAAA